MADETTENDTENTDDVEEGLSVRVVPVGTISSTAAAPTLDKAFTALCLALNTYFDDDLPAQLHCDEIQGWYANGNIAVSWAHAVQMLEQVIGMPLRG